METTIKDIINLDFWTITAVSDLGEKYLIEAKAQYNMVNVPNRVAIEASKNYCDRLNRQKHGVPFFYLKEIKTPKATINQ